MGKVLVTGGAGYFGSLLVKKLVERNLEVRSYDLNLAEDLPASVEQIRGDILDADRLARALDGVDVVFHNVAQVPLAKDIKRFWSVNRDGTEGVLRGSVARGVKSFVYTSSSAVFGVPERNPVLETTLPKPVEDYGRAKLAGEELCLLYGLTHGLNVQIVRPRTILGHGRLGIFQILFEWVARGYNVPVLDGGGNIYQFVHAEDLASACILAADQPRPGVYNCGTDRFGTMKELLTGLCAHAGTGSRVKSVWSAPAVNLMRLGYHLGLSPLGPYHWQMYGQSLYFDVEHTRRTLGWAPRFSNEEMITQNYDWYLAERAEILRAKGRSHHRSPVRQGLLQMARFF